MLPDVVSVFNEHAFKLHRKPCLSTRSGSFFHEFAAIFPFWGWGGGLESALAEESDGHGEREEGADEESEME